MKDTGGWDYAKTFQSKFHSGEMNSDIVRRRRWRRMVNSRTVGPVCFEVSWCTVIGRNHSNT